VIGAVTELLREAATEVVLPIFGTRDARAEEKSPGELVTIADRAAEAFIAPRLVALIPDSVVVGEEEASVNPAIFDYLGRAGAVWLLDPIDGTSNFAAGRSPFALMAALLQDGETVASWMLDPIADVLAVAGRGSGAWLNGERVRTNPDGAELVAMRGAVLRRFLPPEFLQHVDAVRSRFLEFTPGSLCTARDYPDVVSGHLDFALYGRTLPWDHIPGALYLSEAGGVVARLDGSRYTAADHARSGLIAARNHLVWAQVREALVPEFARR